jgi:CelD/BcsL family acetyltransferase involved in cellulose biosynthesis
VIEDLDALLPFRDAWNALAETGPGATVFQTFEWLEAWWRIFGARERLRALLVLDGDTLVAAAPLMTRAARAYGRTVTALTFAGGLQSDYNDLLYADAGALGRLLAALRSEGGWDLLELGRIPAASATPRALAAAFPRWRGVFSTAEVCPAYVFDAAHDGSDVLGKKSVRRHVRGLERAGAVAVRHLTRAEDVAGELDDFFQQHVERRSVTEAASNFLDPRAGAFYRLLAEGFAAQGWLLFTVVTLDGKPAAYHYGFVHRRRLVWYKPSFALHLARLSPGEVLLAELFKYCQAHALAELDFTVGDEAFKTRFANVTRRNVSFRAFRSPAVQGMDWARRRVRAGARRVPGLPALARRLGRRA